MSAIALATLLALGPASADTVPLYDDLGNHHHDITTTSPMAQRYFDQGLRLIYGFNHAEAIASFEQALVFDDRCAMCYWGIALAAGPNINLAMDEAAADVALKAVRKAKKNASRTHPVEQAFIAALVRRYGPGAVTDRAPLDSAYAMAMADVARRFPDDDDALVLYADAMMNLTPWLYWTTELKARPGTRELLAALETVTARNPMHAGACHLFIHAVEAAEPKSAEPCADRLAGLMPGAGHIVHMPGHIYIRVGRFADAIGANQHAIHEDESFIADRNPEGAYPLGYYPHNYHFLNFAAMMAGNRGIAIQSAVDLAAKAKPELLRVPGLGGALQHYLEAPLFAWIRFGNWHEILAAPAPPADLAYPNGLYRYARGIAFARSGDAASAQAELALLEKFAAAPELKDLYILGYNSGASVLSVAAATLSGEMAAARGEWDTAIARLRAAVALEDSFIYMEPPEWPIPPRQHLAGVQMAAGRLADAQQSFEKDLDRFPENVWSLRGLASSLAMQGRTDEAADVYTRLAQALRGSDSTKHHSH